MAHEHSERPAPATAWRRPSRPADEIDAPGRPLTLATLQGAAGNRAVAQLLARAGRGQPTLAHLPAVQRNAKFDEAALGKAFDVEGAPDSLGLPPELAAGLAAAWDASFPEGKSMEQGGILVKTKDGKYVWRAGVGKASGSFQVNYKDVGPDEVLVASGHTHPYDTSEGGFTDIAFSAGDLSNMVWQQERVKVVQSGTARFAVAKTSEFDALVAAADTPEKKTALRLEMNALWNTTFAAGAAKKLAFKIRVEQAAQAVCDKYHLVYYAGKDDTVTAKPQAHVESAAPTLPPEPAKLPPVPTTEQAATDTAAKGTGTPVQQSWLGRLWSWITGG
ncbi:hypothetical protein EXU48_20285 [Occultella glacieicola]|uniref:Phage tail protein n=1 Tax=Occultella glacieicola TaxID=2518684 RepID=A0ABY2DYE6_9MICO|nr:hypothetical protein [Occultella glacieicola]TDE89507.1 hypothetical protein EXU48_20285 [Occultella glacieicola]